MDTALPVTHIDMIQHSHLRYVLTSILFCVNVLSSRQVPATSVARLRERREEKESCKVAGGVVRKILRRSTGQQNT